MSASTGSNLRQLGGIEMVMVRCTMGYIVAFIASVIVDWQFRKHGYAKLLAPDAIPPANASADTDDEPGSIRDPWQTRLRPHLRRRPARFHRYHGILDSGGSAGRRSAASS